MCPHTLRFLVATLLAVATLGCRGDGPRIVIVDGWWARDFAVHACSRTMAWHSEHHAEIGEQGCAAVEACPRLMPVVLACSAERSRPPTRPFEGQVVRAMAGEPGCRGLVVARHGGPNEPDLVLTELMRRPHWTLAVDFIPGLERQSWTLLSAKGPGVAAGGEGTVGRIAADVCAAANRRGRL